jgi:pimeloyl-ACP methyl ester carboxylesterase
MAGIVRYGKGWIVISFVTSKDGTRIGFHRIGSGPPLIFVHGTMADHRSWLSFADYIKNDFTVIAMDRRGRLNSGDAEEYQAQREFEDVAAVVGAMAEPAFLFGHSFGGLCALEAALLTDKLRMLILYEPAIPTGEITNRPDIPNHIQDLIDRHEYEEAVVFFMKESAKMSDSELQAYRQTPLWEPRLLLAPTLPRELEVDIHYRFEAQRFEQLKLPCLLLAGEDSPEYYRQGIELVLQALPHSKVITLPGVQHIAHHTKPALLADVMKQHVS